MKVPWKHKVHRQSCTRETPGRSQEATGGDRRRQDAIHHGVYNKAVGKWKVISVFRPHSFCDYDFCGFVMKINRRHKQKERKWNKQKENEPLSLLLMHKHRNMMSAVIMKQKSEESLQPRSSVDETNQRSFLSSVIRCVNTAPLDLTAVFTRPPSSSDLNWSSERSITNKTPLRGNYRPGWDSRPHNTHSGFLLVPRQVSAEQCTFWKIIFQTMTPELQCSNNSINTAHALCAFKSLTFKCLWV